MECGGEDTSNSTNLTRIACCNPQTSNFAQIEQLGNWFWRLAAICQPFKESKSLAEQKDRALRRRVTASSGGLRVGGIIQSLVPRLVFQDTRPQVL